jgi:hypothetical protein
MTRFEDFSPTASRRKSDTTLYSTPGATSARLPTVPAPLLRTLDLYTQDDGDETRAAQGEYLTALGVATQMVQ